MFGIQLASAPSKLERTTSFEMSSKLSEAEKKFWKTPEVVEKLLPFLDPESTLNLARSTDKVPGILQGPHVWNLFISPACPPWQIDIDVVRCLVRIMRLMKNPEDPRQYLLELICESFPPKEDKTHLHMRRLRGRLVQLS